MLFVFLSLINILLAPPQTQDWLSYYNENGRFHILVPSEPELKERMVATATGDVLINSVIVRSAIDSTDNFLYIINFHDLEENLYSYDSSELNKDFLEIIANDISETLKADPLYINHTNVSAFPAIEYRMSYGEDEKQVKGIVILTPKKMYSLQVFTSKQYTLNKNMERFLESFYFEHGM